MIGQQVELIGTGRSVSVRACMCVCVCDFEDQNSFASFHFLFYLQTSNNDNNDYVDNFVRSIICSIATAKIANITFKIVQRYVWMTENPAIMTASLFYLFMSTCCTCWSTVTAII